MIASAVVSRSEPEARPITVALVNNMPDAAFRDTEEQFRRALCSGPDDGEGIALELYTIAQIPRSDRTRALIESRYRDLRELWSEPPDALIVTGTEPKQAQLVYEPYWPQLARLLQWASANVPTVLLSCLAAHAGVLVFDGIERVRRSSKCCGVFHGRVCDASDPLAEGLPDTVAVPHSRANNIPEAALLRAGYRIVVGSGARGEGWSVAARERGDSLFVLCQGHPEYSTLSLLREYRRDVRRCLLAGAACEYPRLPHGYLSAEAIKTLTAFARRATGGREDPTTLWSEFPYDQVAGSVQNTWAGGSATLYANWLATARLACAVPA
ncbi:MAG: homoserine O-acetyltransferase/O-succinyltransferase family protein [Solirubrobacteraceae bacterium]